MGGWGLAGAAPGDGPCARPGPTRGDRRRAAGLGQQAKASGLQWETGRTEENDHNVNDFLVSEQHFRSSEYRSYSCEQQGYLFMNF